MTTAENHHSNQENPGVEMNIIKEESNNYGILIITGEAQHLKGCQDLQEKALEMLADGHTTIAVDLRNASFVSASFCGSLISLYKVAEAMGTRIVLVADLDSLTYEVLVQAFLHEIMTIVPSLDLVDETVRTKQS